MPKSASYRIDTLRAISETLDGETIIINLESGSYYSMNKTASEIWNQILVGFSMGAIVTSLANRYDASTETIEKAVDGLIETLKGDHLIIGTDAKSEGTEPTAEASLSKEPFIAPTLEKYEDMQEMLLADPIHDVDDIGWPNLKTA